MPHRRKQIKSNKKVVGEAASSDEQRLEQSTQQGDETWIKPLELQHCSQHPTQCLHYKELVGGEM